MGPQTQQLSLRHPRFRDAIATMVAAIRGQSKDDLLGEDVRQHRRTQRLAWSAVAILTVLLLTAVSLGGVANRQRQVANEQRAIAEDQRGVAEEQRAVATARALQAEALLVRDTDPNTSIRLNLASIAVSSNPRARADLVTTLLRTHFAGSAPTVPVRVGFIDSYVRLNHDGTMLATVDQDRSGRVTVWNTTNPLKPTKLTSLAAQLQPNSSPTFSPDGKLLATAGTDNRLRLWDLTQPSRDQPLVTLESLVGTRAVAFSPDMKTLGAVGLPDIKHQELNWVRLWDLADRAHPKLITTLTDVNDSSGLAFSPTDRTMVTTTGVMTFSEAGEVVKTSGATVWDISDRSRPRSVGPRLPLAGGLVAISPDGALVAVPRERDVRLWDLSRPDHPTLVSTLAGHGASVQAQAFSPSGRLLVTAGADKAVILWDITQPTKPVRVATLSGSREQIETVAFSKDSKAIVSVDSNDVVTQWRTADGRPAKVVTMDEHDGAVTAIATSPDGKLLATASFDATVNLWNIADPSRPVKLATLGGHTTIVNGVAFSPDGHTLAAGSGTIIAEKKFLTGRIVLYDIQNPTQPQISSTTEDRPRWLRWPLIRGASCCRSLAARPLGAVSPSCGTRPMPRTRAKRGPPPRRYL